VLSWTYIVTVVLGGVILAESIASVLLGSAPAGCGKLVYMELVKSTVLITYLERVLVALDRLGRDGRDGHSKDGKG
jgi:hypothetical protein